MVEKEILAWVLACDDLRALARVKAAAEDRSHELTHDDPHGAGVGTRGAGAKPYRQDGVERQA
jgi:hypothetical protein